MAHQPRLPLEEGWASTVHGVGPPAQVRPRFHRASLAPKELQDGGSFDYRVTPSIFLGRTGLGPLRVAWDTDILIDWRDYGEALWEERELPRGLDPAHYSDLKALGLIMTTVWMSRDIRIRPLRRQLTDFGGRRAARADGRRSERKRLLEQLGAALTCGDFEGGFMSRRPGANKPEAWFMAASADRDLVEEAVARGCHVFLTRDKRILRHDDYLSSLLGIRALRPTSLEAHLAQSGELFTPYGAEGIVCDNHKWLHVYGAVCASGAWA